MPPQALQNGNGGSSHAAPSEREREHRQSSSASKTNGSTSKSGRSSSRVLGDYTLSKSLGQGSMGKVKLAHHNVTGQKVRSASVVHEGILMADDLSSMP